MAELMIRRDYVEPFLLAAAGEVRSDADKATKRRSKLSGAYLTEFDRALVWGGSPDHR
jgi:hypothetical protein